MGVSETNIKSTTPKHLFKMNGYNFFHTDRNYTTKGGVGLYVKQDLKAKKVSVKFDKFQPEIVFVEVEVKKNYLVLFINPLV